MKKLLGFAILLAGLSLATAAWACSVPVFRYALERWTSDPYEVLVFHDGPLSAEQESLLEGLALQNTDGVPIANLEIRRIAVAAEMDDATRQLWDAQTEATAPWLVVRPPVATRSPEVEPSTIWSGPLDSSAAAILHDSPLRHEIAERLIGGETAVWVLLESGDKQQDDAAFALLEAELARASAQLKLPEVDEQDIDDGLLLADPSNLRVSFSVERLARDNVDEAPLIAMLLASEPDLAEYDAPMALPVFGRGRVLYALVGQGINAETIDMACRDLIGPCTCQIKEQNPGSDLLMAVDWDARVSLSDEEERPLPPLPGLPDSVVTQPSDDSPSPAETVAVADSQSPVESTVVAMVDVPSEFEPLQCDLPAASRNEGSSVVRNTILTAGVAALGIALAGLILMRRRG